MKRIFLLTLLSALGLSLGACQKQQSEAERNAEIERQVQQRLDAERQTDEQQKLAERQAELEARERALAEKENRPVATPPPVATAAPTARAAASTPTQDAETGSYATFYRKLDPYGDWMETGDYGYVFQPKQAARSRDWRPYTNGHWVYTDAGWTWISEEQFGWATYHYGRWTRLRSVGWVWVPGDQWAPAWVSWRKGNDYVGWAPLPPEARFDRNTGIRNWADNYYDIGPEQYAFVPANEFGAKLSSRVVVPTERNVTIINQTTNVTNITYNNSVIVDRGPSYDDLRARSSQPIERFRLERTEYSNNHRPVFRGEVVALPTADFRPAERATRPNRVTRTIGQAVVERGWTGIEDAQAARKARAKMESEATPPPNLPPKKFVRPDQRSVIPPRPAPVNVSTPAPTAAPASTPIATATAAPVETPVATRRPPRPGAKPRPTMTVPPTATPSPNETPATPPRRPRPTMTPPPPTATATPNETPVTTPGQPVVPATPDTEPGQPSPTENVFSPKAADRNRLEKDRAAQGEKRQARQEEKARRRAELEQKRLERGAKKSEQPETSPPPAATPAEPEATAAPVVPEASPGATESIREKMARVRQERRAGKKGRKGDAAPETSPTPEASASPAAQQP